MTERENFGASARRHARGSSGVDRPIVYPEGREQSSCYPTPNLVSRPPNSQENGHQRPRSRSHSRSRSERASNLMDQNISDVPVIPPRPGSKEWPIPSAVPPGHPEGSFWVRGANGWPQVMTPEQHSIQDRSQVPTVTEAARHNIQMPISQSQFQKVSNRPHYHSTAVPKESTRFSRERSNNTRDPRRARSHSRSRSDQLAHPLDTDAPPVPSILPRSGGQPKKFPVPTVLPPGYSEDTRWVVGSGGWPRLEASHSSVSLFNFVLLLILFLRQTPEQYRARYGVSPPAVAPAREHAQQDDPDPQLLVTASSSHQKPLFKRIFGGILSGNKRAGTPGPTQVPPNSQVPNASPASSRTKQRARTKSM
ncbi:hypothetical protein DL96DRAFT_1716820 [Flagelloscypha sp. PMI_526]|nr:hypothetical protein DL96DRAFT_1716820 [Flagelloscypha sp. PMI_526]